MYNDNWCSSISTLAHETGHNLNLGHSGEIFNGGLRAYADEIGYVSAIVHGRLFCLVV